MIGYVNENLQTRGRDIRFDLRRKCCRAWVQVEYGLREKAPKHPGQEEAVVTRQPAGGAAALAGEGRSAGKPAVGGFSDGGGGWNFPRNSVSQDRVEDAPLPASRRQVL